MTSKSERDAQTSTATEDGLGLSDLVEILEGDVTSLEPEAAIAAIEEWHAALKGTKDETLKEIANGLTNLKKLLKSSKIDGVELGEILAELGEQTSQVADGAERGTKGQLREVGKALSKVGKSLESETASDEKPETSSKQADSSKSARQDGRKASDKAEDEDVGDTPELDDLLEILEDDVTELEPEEAIAAIEEWHDALKGTKDEGLKAVSHSLTELKKLLKSKKADPAKLSEVLTQLGEQTDAAAATAERGTKGQLREVGKALSKIGKALGEEA
jgi:uncharacterized phage infection (PIP) family protein YhgE